MGGPRGRAARMILAGGAVAGGSTTASVTTSVVGAGSAGAAAIRPAGPVAEWQKKHSMQSGV